MSAMYEPKMVLSKGSIVILGGGREASISRLYRGLGSEPNAKTKHQRPREKGGKSGAVTLRRSHGYLVGRQAPVPGHKLGRIHWECLFRGIQPPEKKVPEGRLNGKAP